MRLSYSAVSDMTSCPKKYELRRIHHVEERPIWASLGGSAVHAATEQFDRLVAGGMLTLSRKDAGECQPSEGKRQ